MKNVTKSTFENYFEPLATKKSTKKFKFKFEGSLKVKSSS